MNKPRDWEKDYIDDPDIDGAGIALGILLGLSVIAMGIVVLGAMLYA